MWNTLVHHCCYKNGRLIIFPFFSFRQLFDRGYMSGCGAKVLFKCLKNDYFMNI